MQDWESMIAERVAAHGVVVTCREQDPRRRNKRRKDLRFYERHKNEADFIERRKASMKKYKSNPEVKAHHREYLRIWRKNHVKTEHERELNRDRRNMYLARKRARKILSQVPFEVKVTLQDIGVVTVHIYKENQAA